MNQLGKSSLARGEGGGATMIPPLLFKIISTFKHKQNTKSLQDDQSCTTSILDTHPKHNYVSDVPTQNRVKININCLKLSTRRLSFPLFNISTYNTNKTHKSQQTMLPKHITQLIVNRSHLFETLNTEAELSVGRDSTVAFLQLRRSVPRDVVPGRKKCHRRHK